MGKTRRFLFFPSENATDIELAALGMDAPSTVMQNGFPHRIPVKDFIERYQSHLLS